MLRCENPVEFYVKEGKTLEHIQSWLRTVPFSHLSDIRYFNIYYFIRDLDGTYLYNRFIS